MGPKARVIKFYSGVSDRSEVVHLISQLFSVDGGPGSGNFGHSGRPGKVGGSASSKSGGSTITQKTEELVEDPEFDVFKYFEEEEKKYKEKGPEFQKKVEETIGNLENSGKMRGIARAAKECEGDTRKFARLLTTENMKAIEQQYKSIETEEYFDDYIERLLMTITSDPKRYESTDGMVDGIDISSTYKWSGEQYVEEKFGQLIDTEIEDVIAKQGFNGIPRVMKKDDFDAFLKKNPDMPVMFRTFSAPDKKTVGEYNKDLESGAWYIDCSVGGAKYGQGMYTAYAPQPHVIDFNSPYVNTSENGFPDETLKDKEGRLWRYDPDYEYAGWSDVPAGHAIFGVEDITHKGEIFIVKEQGKTVVDSDGEELPFSAFYGYNSLKVVKQVSEKEAQEPDYSRPMGQMKMYKKGNEEREARFEIYGNADESGMVRDLGSPIRDVYINGWRFRPDTSTEIKIEEKKWPKLEKGHYILDYDVAYSGLKKSSTQEIVYVDKNGAVRPTGGEHRPDFFDEDWFEKFKDVHSNIKIYKAKKVDTSSKVATVTRRMTMDPSTKFVRYEDIADEYDRYNYGSYGSFKNISSYAVAKGYDAVVCDNYGKTIVVLNRTKLVMSDENVDVPV